ncbi:MAG TPA: WYL domain-containing protein [Actinomycetota bacterium]|nr:WYL domain-containing protein [Actinomycetota bacterium]
MADEYGRLGNRLRRILVVLPYVIQHPGVTLGELAERFGASRRELLDDLNMVAMCGLPGYTPLELIDVSIGDDDSVVVSMADYFAAPLRLSAVEALTLYAGAAAYATVEELDGADSLQRALAKLRSALGAPGSDELQVDVDAAPGEHLATIRRALEERRRVRLEYFSATRGALTDREVDPWGMIAALGRWYLVGLDHDSGEERIFRIDRVKSAALLDDPAPVPDDFDPGRYRGGFSGAGGGEVTMELSPRAAEWFPEYYPVEETRVLDDGWTRVTLRSGGDHWAATLLLRLGKEARAVEPESVRRAARNLAEAVAARHAG